VPKARRHPDRVSGGKELLGGASQGGLEERVASPLTISEYFALDAVHLLLETASHVAQYINFTTVLFLIIMLAVDKVPHSRLVEIMTEAGFPPS